MGEERAIDANGAVICAESFGERDDPPLLLLMGAGASMLWWEEGFCRMLAERGRFVIRYDHRDTGRSTSYEPGKPGYTGVDLTTDATAVLDGFGIAAAHLVGVSAGGGIAQEIAVRSPGRVLSLVLMSTTGALPPERELPPPTDEFMHFAETAEVDWTNRDSIIDYLTAYQRVLSGGRRPFGEKTTRELVGRDVDRARNPAAAQNHDLLPEGDAPEGGLGDISAPTLVIHGSADPMFPLAHGQALAEEIPGARLLVLENAGHGVFREDWEQLVDAVVEHTAGEAGERRATL